MFVQVIVNNLQGCWSALRTEGFQRSNVLVRNFNSCYWINTKSVTEILDGMLERLAQKRV